MTSVARITPEVSCLARFGDDWIIHLRKQPRSDVCSVDAQLARPHLFVPGLAQVRLLTQPTLHYTNSETMRTKVRFFARLSDLTGVRETSIEVGEGLSMADLFAALCSRYPELKDYEERLAFAVGNEYVDASFPLRGGEDVALIPPVSGGCSVGGSDDT